MPSARPAPILLDTCALLWASGGLPLERSAQAELEAVNRGEVELMVSPISAWEIGVLVARGRLVLGMEPRPWFGKLVEAGMTLAPMPPEVLIGASQLSRSELRDPVDRVLVATAREFGLRLMTRDRGLLDYGARGHLRAIRC